jgi:2-iminobutanoate/2-iminopropanoate deaminase
MKIISTTNAPAAIGPYSQAISSGSFVYCSGQLGVDPELKKMVSEDVIEQTEQIFKNIQAVLKEENLGLANIIKTTIFLQSMDDFAAVNKVYGEQFGDHKPARSTVEVAKLPLNGKIEIEVIAIKE